MANCLSYKFLSTAIYVLIFGFIFNQASAQVITNYNFTPTAGTFTSLVGGSTPGGVGTVDDGAFNNLDIGFDFWYMGVKYNTISAGTNGLLSLGAPITATGYLSANDLSTLGGTNRPILAPLWDDLSIVLPGNFSYLTTGVVGSRLFTCQYINAKWRYNAYGNTISFQVMLEEATGKISFVYQPGTGGVNAGSASIGITATATGNPNFLSLDNFTATAVASSTVSTTSISVKPATGQTYSFLSTVNAPTSLTFTAVSATGMTLNWVDNAADETGYVIYQSVDGGSTYTYAALTAANATSYAATGLNGYTNYFWKVFALRETLSSPLAGRQNMALAANYSYPFTGNANDVSGNNNNGSVAGGVTLSTDRFGNENSAYTLNGTDGNITTTSNIAAPQVFSISIWFKTTTTQGGKLIGFGNQQSGKSGNYDRHIYMTNDGKLSFGVYNGGARVIPSPNAYNDNVWHNAIGILSGTGMKFYVDGIPVGTDTNTDAENNTGYWRIGYDNLGGWPNRPLSDYFAGSLDDIQIFNREISVAEVAVINNALFNGYAYKKTLTLNTTNIISGTQTNFPYLISITDPDLKQTTNGCDLTGGNTSFGKVTSATGADIAFTTTDGVALSYDIDKYDPATGSLLVWVKLPSVSNVANLAINMLFGKLTPDVNNEAAVWSDYKTVFHFKENTFSGTTKDATVGLVGTTAGGMSASNLVVGKIGTAYGFNGTNQYIGVQSSAAYTITSSPYTLSAWINTNAPAADQKIISNQNSANLGYKMGLYGTNPELQNDGTVARNGQPNMTGSYFNAQANTWYYVQGVYNGTTMSMFVNGVAQQTRTGANAPTAGGVLNIGVGEGAAGFYFSGIIDEPRVSNTARNASWALSEYQNQNNPTGSVASIGGLLADRTNASTYPGLVYTFTGASSDNIIGTGNYTNNTINLTELPANTANVSIVMPANGYAVLYAPRSFYGLSIGGNSKLVLYGNTLNIGCNVYNSGIIEGYTVDFANPTNLNSILAFNGSLATQQYFGNATTSSFGGLTVNNSAGGTLNINANSNLNLYGTITLTKGKLSTSNIGAGKLTLKSIENQTASVATVPAAGSISGNVFVERFIKGNNDKSRRGYRLMSSPVHHTTVSPFNYNIFNLKQNMYITGNPDAADIGTSSPNDAAKFDWSPNHNPTIYKYNEPVSGAVSPYDYASISLPLDANIFKVGEGAYVFFRGKRTALDGAGVSRFSTQVKPEDVSLVFKGELNVGQFSPALSYTSTGNTNIDGFNLVGNPYPATIDLSSTNMGYNNLTNFIYVLNPATKSFGVFDRTGTAPGTGDASRYIASGQGFFVKAMSAASPSITFRETAKVNQQLRTSPSPGSVLLMGLKQAKASKETEPQSIRLKMVNQVDSNATDDIVIGFSSQANDNFDQMEDAFDMGGNGTTFLSSFSKDNIKLAINKYAAITNDTKIKLSVISTVSGDFNLIANDLKTLDPKFETYLIDNYKVDTIKLSTQDTYAFKIDRKMPSTYTESRFELAFKNRNDTVLPIELVSFTAKADNNTALLKWQTASESNNKKFIISRSFNGTDYIEIGTVIGSVNSQNVNQYSFTDISPAKGSNYYRLSQQDLNGTTKIIGIKVLNFGLSYLDHNFTIYPVPVNNTLNIVLSKKYENETFVRVLNISGQVILKSSFTGTTASLDFAQFSPGVYIVELTNSNKTLGRSKFTKE